MGRTGRRTFRTAPTPALQAAYPQRYQARTTPALDAVYPQRHHARTVSDDAELNRVLMVSRQAAEQEAAELQQAVIASLNDSQDEDAALARALKLSRDGDEELKDCAADEVIALNGLRAGMQYVQNSTSDSSFCNDKTSSLSASTLAPAMPTATITQRCQHTELNWAQQAVDASRHDSGPSQDVIALNRSRAEAQLARKSTSSSLSSSSRKVAVKGVKGVPAAVALRDAPKQPAKEDDGLAMLLRASALAAEAEATAIAQAIAASLTTSESTSAPTAQTPLLPRSSLAVSIATPPASPRDTHRSASGDGWTLIQDEENGDEDWLYA